LNSLTTCANWEWVREAYMIWTGASKCYDKSIDSMEKKKCVLPLESELCTLYCSSQASEAHSRESVLPVPVGLSRIPFWPFE
jgi:hypothetical protein